MILDAAVGEPDGLIGHVLLKRLYAEEYIRKSAFMSDVKSEHL